MNSSRIPERDLLVALLEAVMGLSEKSFPDEKMQIQVRYRDAEDGEETFVWIGNPTQVRWIKESS